jgi:hypothetical protein
VCALTCAAAACFFLAAFTAFTILPMALAFAVAYGVLLIRAAAGSRGSDWNTTVLSQCSENSSACRGCRLAWGMVR